MTIFVLPYCAPLNVFAALHQHHSTAMLLNGAHTQGGKSRYSYIAVNPRHIITADATCVFVDGICTEGDPFAVLERQLRMHADDLMEMDAPVPFKGGAIGALGYELGECLESLPSAKSDRIALPRMYIGLYDTYVAFDHDEKKLWVIGRDESKTQDLARHVTEITDDTSELDWSVMGSGHAEQTQQQVEDNIRLIKEYIYAGDIFQANFTQRFLVMRPDGLDDFTIYKRLCDLSPSPFSAFLRCDGMALASASPERFLRLGSDGCVEAWPIKGTSPRDTDPVRDNQLATELAQSPKDRAENLMIVDLMRNDLSRICDVGSIKVTQLHELESFASVHHLVSRVEGRLQSGLHPIDVLRATFPGGSITGAPKIRAMEIIHELEPAPRGFYCGCLGWIGCDGAMDMSMTIRTLTMTHDTIIAQAGGGIVADSNPAAEYEESMIKIKPLLQAVMGKAS